MEIPMYKLLIAKTDREDPDCWLPLWMHCKDAAGMMRLLWNCWLPDSERKIICGDLEEADLGKLCIFLGCAHDLGKASNSFQFRVAPCVPEIEGWLEEGNLNLRQTSDSVNIPHACMSEEILLRHHCNETVAAIAGAHHGKPQEWRKPLMIDMYPASYYASQQDMWEGFWQSLIQLALEESGFASLDEIPEVTLEQQMLLTGLLIMADWLSSCTDYFPLISCSETGNESMYPARVDDAWKCVNLPQFWKQDSFGLDDAAFKERFGFFPNEVQRAFIEKAEASMAPGIYILEAQMGVGKTEAALAAAEVFAQRFGVGGVFFGLPTQATANGLFPRMKSWAEYQSENSRLAIRLAHGMAGLNDDYVQIFDSRANVEADEDTGLVVHQWFQGRMQASLSNFVVGTVDQCLMAALQQRHVMLRQLGLAGKVVIIDECHAYDAYMNQYLMRALNWLGAYGVPVIILSATLPAERRAELIYAYANSKRSVRKQPAEWKVSRAYPLLTWFEKGGAVQQYKIPMDCENREVSVLRISDAERINVLKEALSDGGTAACIVNTVRRAQELYEEIRTSIPDAEILMLHASFIMPDRMSCEQELIRRLGKHSGEKERKKFVVVGTQVLEQSLDIDVDVMISDLAPMDLLLQRVGRLHRHRHHDVLRPEKLKTATLYVVSGEDGELEPGAKCIYTEWLLRRTEKLLPDKVLLPQDIPDLVNDTYDDTVHVLEETEAVRVAKQEYDRRIGEAKNKGAAFRIESPEDGNEFCDLFCVPEISGVKAEATVRDGDPSIEVILLRENEGAVCYLPWQNNGDEVSSDCRPCWEECRDLLKQRIRLPHRFGQPWMVEKTIAELEKVKQKRFSEWSYVPALAGELILLLDENFETELCGCCLSYDKNLGLFTKGDANES